MKVTIHLLTQKGAEAQNRNCSAVPQMLGIGRRCVLFAHEQADNNADVALLNSYE
ncbi:MAG: hypothetical protein KKD63_13510 [Proteobacteria bacterium]|nr:hypothetical protein [Pseudomonadota bacterium]